MATWIRAICGGVALSLMAVISASAASGAQPPEPSSGSGTAPVVEKPKYPDFPSETPSSVARPTAGADFDRREVMIAMRDGVKLHTIRSEERRVGKECLE